MPRIALIFFLGLIPHLVQARMIKVWTPDELTSVSKIVCNGIVLQIDKLGETKSPDSLHRTLQWKARLKVLSFWRKGVGFDDCFLPPPQIDFFYTQNVEMKNGPCTFTLKVGQRYRFYLNPAPSGGYVSALDTDKDNLWSVENLATEERDSSPSFLEKEAVGRVSGLVYARFAWMRPFLAAHLTLDLSAPVHSSTRSPFEEPPFTVKADRSLWRIGDGADPNIWRVQVWFLPDNPTRDPSSDGELIFRPDRSLDPSSWLAAGPALKGKEISSQDCGEHVRILCTGSSQKIVRGRLEQVTPQKIVLSDARENETGQPHPMEIPRDTILKAWMVWPLPKR